MMPLISSSDSPAAISADTTTNKVSGGSVAAIVIGVVLGLLLLMYTIVYVRKRIRARENQKKVRRLALLAQERWLVGRDGEKDGSRPNSWSGEKYFRDLEATPTIQGSQTSPPSSDHFSPLAMPPKAVTYTPGKKVGSLPGVLMTQAPIAKSLNHGDFRLPHDSTKTELNGGRSRIHPPGLVSQSWDANQPGAIQYGPTPPTLVRHPSVRSQRADISRPGHMELGTLSADSSARRQYQLKPKVEMTPMTKPPQDGWGVPDITLSPATPRLSRGKDSNRRSR